ncbi:MAG TPA: sigma-70 family RNA polymerase sigma factor [Pseudonocardiaceae bacterium]|jgi:RNA polymerase sigma-70 factor (ECF subfamily)|nr:sigma-70 family RNA polymerase sigma factor [Pseudonocardiaceae bacterium]
MTRTRRTSDDRDVGSLDRSGFVDLFWRHGPAVHSYLSRRAGRQDADDLLGEVWLQAFRSRTRYDRSWPDPLPWLYGIAHNVLRAHLRSHRPTAGYQQPPDRPADDPWSAVDDRLDAARDAPMIRAALAALTADDREVLLLVAWEQLRPAEVAIALDLPQGTVRSRLHRARTQLRRHLDTSEPAAAVRPVLVEANDE